MNLCILHADAISINTMVNMHETGNWYACSTVQACMAAHSLLYRSVYFYCFLDREHIDEEPDEIDGDLQEAIASSLKKEIGMCKH